MDAVMWRFVALRARTRSAERRQHRPSSGGVAAVRVYKLVVERKGTDVKFSVNLTPRSVRNTRPDPTTHCVCKSDIDPYVVCCVP